MEPNRDIKLDTIALFDTANARLGLGDLDAWLSEIGVGATEGGSWLDNHDFTGPEHAKWAKVAETIAWRNGGMRVFLAGLRDVLDV